MPRYITPRRLEFESAPTDVAATERAMQGCLENNDCKEAQAAFMDKRKPQFAGT